MPHFLAIDQSTSATKALLFNERLELLDREGIEHVQHYPRAGWVEHDAEEIWQNLLTVARRLLGRRPAEAESLCSLSITNQRETIVVFEKSSGKPLYPALVWQCRRGVGLCDAANAGGLGQLVEERTGLKIDAYFSASKLKWLMQNEPEIARKVRSGEALVGTIDAYLIYRLTEGRTFATDTTNASRTLLYDIALLRWDEALCELWDTPLHALPEVRDCEAKFGETTLGGILKEALPICGVMGDSQAALFAQGCYEPGSAKVTFGTGSSILLNVGSEMKRSDNGVVTTLAWTRGGIPTYAMEGIIISSAATLAWLKNQLGLFESYSEVEPMARELTGNGGVYLVPAFTGLGLPYWKADARATIVGLSSQSDRRHLVRAGIESMAYQVSEALAAMREDAGVSLSGLKADGGATKNSFLMQLVADLCRVDLSVAGMPECSPLGATMAGMLGMGLVVSPEDFSLGSAEGFTPRMLAEESDRLLGEWRSAVQQTLAPLEAKDPLYL
ncbi:glycerol kinase GlpK [Pelagicoccus sp. SDUM812005]|uniref:FGGY family carbohydrate kinase n=1 Tax=Pelagicoccus sp. SDUM812005 TaxID=3041257 RepID=UPI00280F67D6|nr:glycerol kinase GlpK [Pelagicoccus sp. SDUM812005]MDQ8179350.1 glycerol kinase GlpK [Pelagicoccus sp. SDUM812005]